MTRAFPHNCAFDAVYHCSGAAIFAVGQAIACSAPTLVALIIGRCIAGLGEGLFLSTASTYVIEISPKDHRGRLSAVRQVCINVGESSRTAAQVQALIQLRRRLRLLCLLWNRPDTLRRLVPHSVWRSDRLRDHSCLRHAFPTLQSPMARPKRFV